MDLFERMITYTNETELNLIVFIFAYLEYLLPVIPGDLALAFGVFMGIYGGYSVVPIYFSSVIGGSAGALTVLLIGKYVSHKYNQARLAKFINRYYANSNDRIVKAVELIQRYGLFIIMANRFIPLLRGLIIFAAGYSGVDLLRAYISAITSALLFNLIITLLSISVGRNFDVIKSLLSHYFEGVILLVIFIILIYKLIAYLKRGKV